MSRDITLPYSLNPELEGEQSKVYSNKARPNEQIHFLVYEQYELNLCS